MDYEKKYKEALERAKKLQENSNGMILKKWLWNIFPELKESEDEKIRKAMIKGLSSCASKYWGGFEIKAAIAWLEKQEGKHKTEPQSRWWPSEKQMRMLHSAIEVKAPGAVRDGLESLYNDLKNL